MSLSKNGNLLVQIVSKCQVGMTSGPAGFRGSTSSVPSPCFSSISWSCFFLGIGPTFPTATSAM